MSEIPGIPSTIVIDIRPTIGALFCGAIAAAVFYGVTLLQTIFYFQTYPNDKVFFRCLVLVIWALDTLDLILVVNGVWTWTIVNYANPVALLQVPWSIKTEPVIISTISVLVHLFMAYRIRTLNKRLTPIAIAIGAVSLFNWALGIFATIHSFRASGNIQTLNHGLHWAYASANVSSAVLDVSIMTTLCLQLYSSNHGFEKFSRTRRILTYLSAYMVANNLITSTITVTGVITYFSASKTLVYYAFLCLTSKAYTNTFLAQLNAREHIRHQVDQATSHLTAVTNRSLSSAFHSKQRAVIEIDQLTETTLDIVNPNLESPSTASVDYRKVGGDIRI
ncbi:hypothetical protein BDP27DRAFT_1330992 [Rhodocollybia butyracea]|uniref:DUF6534 domain-containing protein n=1 Tax=Rhodocollybia butyracea TaxID=206335 RepID=A0A9P5PIN1_9AGAR|nr:hypothetical protein BDP27DRAFT_1330992 [Rhodocollybia butyracea]